MKKNILVFIVSGFLLMSCSLFKPSTFVPPETTQPSQVSQINESPQTTTKKVTLFVPLSGKLADNGEAIRNGFFAAYQDSLQHGQEEMIITVVDTNNSNVKELYNQAVANGAEFVVGPLTKPEVEQIATLGNLPVPTLALNTTDNYFKNKTPNLYQFGLSSRDEAIQITQRAWDRQLRQALIIAPDNTRGQSLAMTLNDSWHYFGGKVKSTIMYTNMASANKQLQTILNINMSKDTKNHEKFEPYTGNDIDVIFLIASPEQGRQINPLIKFYLNPNIPVYSISEIYSGTPSPNLDMDLEGITFCDMPWILQAGNLSEPLLSIQNKLIDSFGGAYKINNRLYALGVDAYYLMVNFNDLSSASKISFSGATGVLSIDQYQHVYRSLSFAKMHNGVPEGT